MTIGQDWRRDQDDIDPNTPKARSSAMRQTAQDIIAKIPKLIADARRVNPSVASVGVYGFVTGDDVAGDSNDRVEALASRRCGAPLQNGDLAGSAKHIFDWCIANHLECVLVSVRIPLNDNEYNLHVRPMR